MGWARQGAAHNFSILYQYRSTLKRPGLSGIEPVFGDDDPFDVRTIRLISKADACGGGRSWSNSRPGANPGASIMAGVAGGACDSALGCDLLKLVTLGLVPRGHGGRRLDGGPF